MGRFGIALATLGMMALLLAGISLAHTKNYGVSVTADGDESDPSKVKVTGTVSSGKPACKANRVVKLVGREGQVIARMTTDQTGKFAASINPETVPRDIYEAELGTKRLQPRNNQHRHVCRAAEDGVGAFGEEDSPGGPGGPKGPK